MLTFSKMIMSVTVMAASVLMLGPSDGLAVPPCGDFFCDGAEGETPCNCTADCGFQDPVEAGPACTDGIDNDCDGLTDCDDPTDCASEPECIVVVSPTFAAAPHNILKNRYISIDPRGEGGLNLGLDLDIRVTLTTTQVNGVSAVGSSWWANAPDADCISIVGLTRPASAPNWDACPTLHLTGCPIIPTSTYDIVVVDGGTESAPPLAASTQALPSGSRWWGDCVGIFVPGTGWNPPNGFVSIDDAFAAIKTYQNPSATPGCGTPPCNATHVSVTDMHPAGFPLQPWGTPNRLVSIDDVFAIILGYQGSEYPGPQIHLCTDP